MKLFRCEVNFTYYCLAENATKAGYLARDAAADISLSDCVDTDSVYTFSLCYTDGWLPNSLVYGTQEDVTLEQAIAKYAL